MTDMDLSLPRDWWRWVGHAVVREKPLGLEMSTTKEVVAKGLNKERRMMSDFILSRNAKCLFSVECLLRYSEG